MQQAFIVGAGRLMGTRVLDVIVDGYLDRLDESLIGIPERRRRELVRDVGERIQLARLEMPAESEARVRAVLAALGSPEEIAAEEHSFHPWSARRSRFRRGAAAIIAISLVGAGSVTVVAATGRPPRSGDTAVVEVPTVIGRSEALAEAELRRADLSVGTIGHVADHSVRVGTVVGERPDAGSAVRRGSGVSLDVATGS